MSHEAFYSTAAQVIPVLVLVLFVERRVIGSDGADAVRSATVLKLFVLVALGWGELAAVNGLLVGDESDLSLTVVFGALMIGCGALVYPYFALLANSLARDGAVGIGGLVATACCAALMVTRDDPRVLLWAAIASTTGLAAYYFAVRRTEDRRDMAEARALFFVLWVMEARRRQALVAQELRDCDVERDGEAFEHP